MAIPVIVMGVLGRMGSTIAHLAKADTALTLVGVVERPEAVNQVTQAGCTVASSVEPLLAANPGAIVVEFTTPEVTLTTARAVARAGACHVIGTTGFTEIQKAELAGIAEQVPLFWAPNMSIGVQALLKVLPELTRLLGDDYDVEMLEIHHKHKKDAPSGTALRLAEALAETKGWPLREAACYHREGITGERPHKTIGMQTLRGGDVVGVHTVYFMGQGERIELIHQAHSRENFAKGALRAAKWLSGQKPGRVYSMQDMLG
ncbi:hypothetical protein B566_EDAN018963 [Ephemera danica]|nr:hypothetical protein B566_EDAN018963 [Ephemera danica]